MAAFLCTVQYGQPGHEILVEIWLENDKAPGVTDREEVELALREAAASGVAPEGWRVAVVNWSHPRSAHTGGAADLAQFDALIRNSEITVEDKGNRKPPKGLEPEGEE